MTGKISNITDKYVIIESNDDREEQVDLKGWTLAHGTPTIGDPIIRVRACVKNYLGGHQYGYLPLYTPIPEGMEPDGWRGPNRFEFWS